MTRKLAVSISCLLVLVAALGCADSARPSDGGAPVRIGGMARFTSERLARSRLVDIRAKPEIVWRFEAERFEVACAGGLPADIAEPLGAKNRANRSSGRWRIEQSAGGTTRDTLVLQIDSTGREARLPIEAAGAVRCDLGGRQYNVFPCSKRILIP